MASYSAEQLREGVPTEALSGTKTFTLSKTTSGASYFTFETVANNTGSYTTEATNAVGTYASFTSIDADSLVSSSYIFSVIVPEGGGSFTFAPTSNVAISSSLLRGTGGISLVIS